MFYYYHHDACFIYVGNQCHKPPKLEGMCHPFRVMIIPQGSYSKLDRKLGSLFETHNENLVIEWWLLIIDNYRIFYPDHLSQWLPMIIIRIFFENSRTSHKKRTQKAKKIMNMIIHPKLYSFASTRASPRSRRSTSRKMIKWWVRSSYIPYGCAFFYRLYMAIPPKWLC